MAPSGIEFMAAPRDAVECLDGADGPRLAADYASGVKPDPGLGRIVRLAASGLGRPMAAIVLADRDRVRLHASVGLDPVALPRSGSFCDAILRDGRVLVVADASRVPAFARHPLVVGAPGIRFYAGAPLVTADGLRLGALCVMDATPHDTFTNDQARFLAELAALVTDQVALQRAALEHEAVAGFSGASEFALMTIDGNGTVVFVNAACEALYGYRRSEMLGRNMDFIIPEPFREAHKAGLARIAAGGASKMAGRTVQITALRRDGTIIPIEFALSVWHGPTGIGIGAMMRDISEWRERDARLVQMAHHDALTGLANRALFAERLGTVLAAGVNATVMLLDLGGFKEVNDSLGHGTGDTLLQAVAIRLSGCATGTMTVARFGGDEFAILMPGTADPLKAGAFAATVLDAFRAPFHLGGHTFHVGLSIGAAIGEAGRPSPDELVADADLALYQSKRDGRRCVRLFEPAMRIAVIARRTLHDELTRALDAGEFVLHYQPQVALQSGRIIGVEALLRWEHPRRGLLLPGAFLSALEAHPIAQALGGWIIEEACRQAARWRAAGLPPIRMAINLFGAQLPGGTLAADVLRVLARYELAPEALEIEVTERIALQVEDAILDPIRELHRQGVGIAFDDFGTGYASLSSLKRFPLTRLKIDRSFVRDLLTDRHDADIIRAVLGMAQSFGLDVIAEGIETMEQEAVLRAMGCREGQGYLYGKAMTPQAIEALVAPDPSTARGRDAA
jgi:diguanylate cyclase (GGDEF)-like protein/PAS domain S-box-containing protein